MFLYGRNSVIERLKADPKSVKKIFIQDDLDCQPIVDAINKNAIPFKRLPRGELINIKQGDNLQGIIAKVEDFNYSGLDALIEKTVKEKAAMIFLDRVTDPQNLGSIIRTAACLGGFSIVIPKYKACEINETVLHVASGGENYVPIALTPNLSTAIIKAKDSGCWIMGAVVGGGAGDVNKISMPFPLGLVLGSEGEGIRYGVEKHLDIKAAVPMAGAGLSFNVTIACAIFCYEIARRKREDLNH